MCNRVLVLAPHTDDEIMMAGTIAKFDDEGCEIYYSSFSFAEQSIPDGFPIDATRKEVQRSTLILGIPYDNLILLSYKVRQFEYARQDILDDMISLRNHVKPDLVLMPSSFDTHQDHKVIYQEGFRAFKKSNIMGYELPSNNISFRVDAFMSLTLADLNRKLECANSYKSQVNKKKNHIQSLISLAKVRGHQIDTNYAEAFEMIRFII